MLSGSLTYHYPYALVRKHAQITFVNCKHVVSQRSNGNLYSCISYSGETLYFSELLPKENSWNYIVENAVRLDDIEPWWRSPRNEKIPILRKSTYRKPMCMFDLDLDLKEIFRESGPYRYCGIHYVFVPIYPNCYSSTLYCAYNFPIYCQSIEKGPNIKLSRRMVDELSCNRCFCEIVSNLLDKSDSTRRMPYTKMFQRQPTSA